MLKYEHFIFDFDGTLSDSYPAFVKAARIVADKYGAEITDEKIYYLLKKYSTVRLFDELELGQFRDGAYEEFKKLYDEILRSEATAMEGTEALLQIIAENGGKSYVYSHSGDVVLHNSKRWGIDKYFTDYMLGDKSYPRKPAPDALLTLINRHGLDAGKCVMIGDRDIDILAGKNAGLEGILIDDEGYYPELETECRVSELKEIKNFIFA
ncbi:MAG: HAD-IA family hydrolase [Clostridia bacterium]|nr:HAD-IA family hydrolase [Clostridia bacterium]